eukprot:2663114-Rhodomonas_salina.1
MQEPGKASISINAYARPPACASAVAAFTGMSTVACEPTRLTPKCTPNSTLISEGVASKIVRYEALRRKTLAFVPIPALTRARTGRKAGSIKRQKVADPKLHDVDSTAPVSVTSEEKKRDSSAPMPPHAPENSGASQTSSMRSTNKVNFIATNAAGHPVGGVLRTGSTPLCGQAFWR